MSYKDSILRFAIFALGAGVGFLAGKKVYKGYYEAIAQEEIDSVKETFEQYKEKVMKKADASKDATELKMAEKKAGAKMESSAFVRSSLDENPNEKAKKNYHLIRGKKELDKVLEEEDEEQEEGPLTDAAGKSEQEMNSDKIDRLQPYVIDDREFTEEFEHHDKISLYYYTVDEILCDEQEEVIEDVEEKIGDEAISLLDTQTTVWVRNETLAIDYEIISLHKSYAEDVQGIAENLTPREKYLKDLKRGEKRE